MKKIAISFLFFIVTLVSISYCYTDEFELLIDIMGIPKTNFHGKELNEDIYKEYSLFVYGTPLDGYEGQRFKEVLDVGHWTKSSGVWHGDGVRGEYWILRRK